MRFGVFSNPAGLGGALIAGLLWAQADLALLTSQAFAAPPSGRMGARVVGHASATTAGGSTPVPASSSSGGNRGSGVYRSAGYRSGGHHFGRYGHRHHHHGSHYGNFTTGYASYGVGLTVGYGGYGLGVDPYYSPYYAGYGYDPYYLDYGSGVFGPYVLPPIVQPAEAMFGPQAVKRFMGLDPGFALGPLNNQPPLAALPAAARVAPAVDVGPVVRRPNIEAIERSMRFVQQGDASFDAQKHHEALQRYKRAADAAATRAEPWFRQGHALVAMGRFDMAATAFRRGIAADPEWLKNAFRLDSLYGGDQFAKQSHYEALEKALAARPDDEDLLLCLAVTLHFDGQPQRALDLMGRVAAKLGFGDATVRAFGVPRPAAVAAPADAAPDGLDL